MSFSFLASTNLAIVYLRRSGVVNASAFRLIEIETKFDLIHELEWTGNTVTGICKKYGVYQGRLITSGRMGISTMTWVDPVNSVPRTINYKVDTATEETILDLRLKRFGCSRIRFRLKD
jgi:hypothetical protein